MIEPNPDLAALARELLTALYVANGDLEAESEYHMFQAIAGGTDASADGYWRRFVTEPPYIRVSSVLRTLVTAVGWEPPE